MGPFRSREPLQQMTGGTCWLKPAFRQSGRASNGSFPFATACRAEKRSKLSCGSCASLAGFPGWKSPFLRSAKGDRSPARQHVWVMMRGSVCRFIVNRSGGRELTAGLVNRRLGPVGNPYVILARHLPITKTCAEFNNHVPYHCRSRSSEQKPAATDGEARGCNGRRGQRQPRALCIPAASGGDSDRKSRQRRSACSSTLTGGTCSGQFPIWKFSGALNHVTL